MRIPIGFVGSERQSSRESSDGIDPNIVVVCLSSVESDTRSRLLVVHGSVDGRMADGESNLSFMQ